MWYFISSWKLLSENPQDPTDKIHSLIFTQSPLKIQKAQGSPFWKHRQFFKTSCRKGRKGGRTLGSIEVFFIKQKSIAFLRRLWRQFIRKQILADVRLINAEQMYTGQNYTGHWTVFQFILPTIFIFKNVRTFTEVWMYKVRWENHVFNPRWNKNLMTPSISMLHSHYKEKVCFLAFSSQ